MPFEADDIIWRNLLSICMMHGNVEVAEKAANSLLQLDPQDSSAYILLSNIYAYAGMWGEVSEMRKIMKYNKLKKEPGCSWIEVKDEVHTFLVCDKAHPRCKDIYEKLGVLINEMKRDGYVPDIDFVLDEGTEELEEQEELRSCVNGKNWGYKDDMRLRLTDGDVREKGKWEVLPVMGGDCRCASDGRPAGVGLANGAGEEEVRQSLVLRNWNL
nr:pentatricopeptide repeat-containing protein [Quercus suber]